MQGNGWTRILIVDDDAQTLRYVRYALPAAGYVALVAGDSRELSHAVETKESNLVLLDLMLTGTDGIELMERVAELPTIFIPGYRRDETIARALQMGAADYIVKPLFVDGARGESQVRPALARWVGILPAKGLGQPLRATPGYGRRPRGS